MVEKWKVMFEFCMPWGGRVEVHLFVDFMSMVIAPVFLHWQKRPK